MENTSDPALITKHVDRSGLGNKTSC